MVAARGPNQVMTTADIKAKLLKNAKDITVEHNAAKLLFWSGN